MDQEFERIIRDHRERMRQINERYDRERDRINARYQGERLLAKAAMDESRRLVGVALRVAFVVQVVAWIVFAVVLLSSCTVTVPVAATGDTDGTKQGRASAVRVFGAVVQGDASIAAACRQGGVHFVQTVDLRKTNVLGVYRRETCIVTGE